MGLGSFQMTLILVAALAGAEALFDGSLHLPPPTSGDHLVYPKYHGTIKLSHTLSSTADDKFYPFFVPKMKKPKYLVGKLTDGWKALDGEKKEVDLLEPFRVRPVSILDGFNSLPKFDDIKPVTEHIEGDLKYDFRTNTHSI